MRMKAVEIVPLLLETLPSAVDVWEDHVTYWGEEPRGSFTDMAIFAHHVVDLHYIHSSEDELAAFFEALEFLLREGDDEVRQLAIIGLIEDIQTIASWRPNGAAVFEHRLGPLSRDAWNEVMQLWQGAESLADVVRREKYASKRGT